MTIKEVADGYFEWMYDLVCHKQHIARRGYRKLFYRLHNTEFTYTIEMDGNRASDGMNLRYRYGRANDIPDPVVASCLDSTDCSVLEMMVALAVRCEEQIMQDSDIGDRTGEWFWEMITSLGLTTMSDDRFDSDYVDKVIFRFLEREYSPNGVGGLFLVRDPLYDMRDAEIWYQMNWYLKEITYKEWLA